MAETAPHPLEAWAREPGADAAPEGAAFTTNGRNSFYAILRRRRAKPKPTRAEPSSARDVGSGTGGVTTMAAEALPEVLAVVLPNELLTSATVLLRFENDSAKALSMPRSPAGITEEVKVMSVGGGVVAANIREEPPTVPTRTSTTVPDKKLVPPPPARLVIVKDPV